MNSKLREKSQYHKFVKTQIRENYLIYSIQIFTNLKLCLATAIKKQSWCVLRGIMSRWIEKIHTQAISYSVVIQIRQLQGDFNTHFSYKYLYFWRTNRKTDKDVFGTCGLIITAFIIILRVSIFYQPIRTIQINCNTIKPFSAGIDFSRQNLTSADRLKSIPAL